MSLCSGINIFCSRLLTLGRSRINGAGFPVCNKTFGGTKYIPYKISWTQNVVFVNSRYTSLYTNRYEWNILARQYHILVGYSSP